MGRSDGTNKVPLLRAPSRQEFFEKYVLLNRPAMFHCVFGTGENLAQLQSLADSNFLKQICGHRRVPVKDLAYQDRMGRPNFVTDPLLRLPLADFLDSLDMYENGGPRPPFYLGKVPLCQELPELDAEIQRFGFDAFRHVYESCFGTPVPQGVVAYLGCARNTTPVHFDAYENLMLCVRGSKRLFLYPPSDARYLYPVGVGPSYPDIDFTNAAAPPFTRFEDMPKEMQEKYTLLKWATPIEVFLDPGDILYLPACWWHCVEGSEERNLIFSWWFHLHPQKLALACPLPQG